MTQGMFIETNGVSLRYKTSGSGPPLCLIAGYRMHGQVWPVSFIDRLAERFTVITYDCRGTGLSDKPNRDYAVSTMATDVSGLIQAIGFHRVHVLGFSMGGAVAQELAINHL